MEREFNDQQLVRRQKAEDLKTKGINPFGNAFKRTANSKTIKEEMLISEYNLIENRPDRENEIVGK